jgi:hypothetical protein
VRSVTQSRVSWLLIHDPPPFAEQLSHQRLQCCARHVKFGCQILFGWGDTPRGKSILRLSNICEAIIPSRTHELTPTM